MSTVTTDHLGRYLYAFAVAAFLSFIALGLAVEFTASSAADFRSTLFQLALPVTVIGGVIGMVLRRVLSF